MFVYMRSFYDSQAVFEQLASLEASGSEAGGGAVKCIIENHDAWIHNCQIETLLNAAHRLQIARSQRDEVVAARIRRQRASLGTLITRLPQRISSAG